MSIIKPCIYLTIVVFLATGCATMQRTDLFFGMNVPGGGIVSDTDWKSFIDTAVSRRFPEGYTELDALGKWMDTDSKETISEHTRVLVFIGKKTKVRELMLDTITQSYIHQYRQQAVLRLDSKTKASFVKKKGKT